MICFKNANRRKSSVSVGVWIFMSLILQLKNVCIQHTAYAKHGKFGVSNPKPIVCGVYYAMMTHTLYSRWVVQS